MLYASRSDIELRRIPREELIALCDDEEQGASNPAIDQRVEEALKAATAEIDALIGSRYAVPLREPVPELVRQICVDIAAERLFQRRSGEIPQTIRDAARRARALLDQIASGQLRLYGRSMMHVWTRQRVLKDIGFE